MSETDPDDPVDDQAQKFIILAAVKKSDGKPYPLRQGEDGGLGVSAIIVSKTIGSVIFTGSGLNDMSNGGEFIGSVDRQFVVAIDGTGTPDTFEWSKDGGVTQEATNVPITGNDQVLMEGVTIKFNATTGHTGGDEWAFTAKAADPTAMRKTVTLIEFASIAPLGSITSDVVDLEQVKAGALTVKGDFDGAASLGMKVEIFTSHDNINWDTQPWASTGLEPALVAGSTEQVTRNLNTLPRYLKVTITDLEKGIGNLAVTFTALKE